ncbi:MAG TPA: hypothetical protein VGY54_02395 [Polyangiaceae bacterium]|jgi:hypothetical protein|nr:hypothetical protein [Polyangiaceae bacterium]
MRHARGFPETNVGQFESQSRTFLSKTMGSALAKTLAAGERTNFIVERANQ